MKFLKMPGLFALAALSLMAFTPGAGATTFTSPAGTAYTGEIIFVSEGHITIHNPIVKIECESVAVQKKVETHGSGVTGQSSLTSLAFAPCTNNWHVTQVSPGALEVHHLVGTNNGTVTSSGMTLEATRFGVICRFITNNTDIGTLTGGNPATMHLEGALALHTNSSPLCGPGPFKLTGAYKVNTPASLFISA